MVKKVISIISKIISGAIYIMIIIATCITLLPLIAGYRPVVVLSGSMEPSYPVGSMIYYKASSFEDIKEGDVITFKLGGGALATHRVTQKDSVNREFTTKGDNNQTEDAQPISYEAVVGKTEKIAIPYVGFIGNYIRKVPIMIMLAGVLLICSILSPTKMEEKGESICKR
jgi:signal peptidase I, archaeal type